jgi:ABC-type sugar transport system ATPase subunit
MADRSNGGAPPLVELREIVKRFGSVIALNGVTMKVHAGEVMCLLGDNGAGKSTLIKTLSGVHQPTDGQILIDGEPVAMGSPRDALDRGIATVYQDLAMIPLMSITRNFFMGRARAQQASRCRAGDFHDGTRVGLRLVGRIVRGRVGSESNVGFRFTPPERGSFKPTPLLASSNLLIYRASDNRTKRGVVRLCQRKGRRERRKTAQNGLRDRWSWFGQLARNGRILRDSDR